MEAVGVGRVTSSTPNQIRRLFSDEFEVGDMSGIQITPLISALITGVIGLIGTLAGVYYQRRSETHRQLANQIYQPMYDELVEVSEGDLPFDTSDERFRSYWFELDRYWHSRVDDELRNQIEEYVDLLEIANLAFLEIAEEIISNRKLSDVKDTRSTSGSSEYVEAKLLFKQSSSGGRKTYTPLVEWFEAYSTALLEATDTTELRRKLEEQADDLSPEHRRAIDSWEDKHLRELGKAIQEADEQVDFPGTISSTEELFENLKSEAESLSEAVKQKTDGLI